MFCLSPISTRDQFGILLNQLGLVNEAVEIGTHRGEFADIFLARWYGYKLHCVDPWEDYPQATSLWGGGTRKDDYKQAQAVARKHRNRMILHRTTSLLSAKEITNDLDFVYIDGNHTYEDVFQDLSVWWPKLKTNGILAGHDWLCPGEKENGWAQYIQPAFEQFVKNTNSVNIYLITEENNLPWSFYMFKS